MALATQATRVLVADDRPEVRQALKLLLDVQAGLTHIDEASDARSLFTQIQAQPPDLLLLDWELPGLKRDDLADLRAAAPSAAIIAISGRPEAHQTALAAGVDGFASKTHPPEQLLCVLATIGERENGQSA